MSNDLPEIRLVDLKNWERRDPVWRTIRAMIKSHMNDLRRVLLTETDHAKILHVQGQYQAFEGLLELPKLLKDELEHKKSEAQEAENQEESEHHEDTENQD